MYDARERRTPRRAVTRSAADGAVLDGVPPGSLREGRLPCPERRELLQTGEHPDQLIKAALDTLAIPTAVLDGDRRSLLVISAGATCCMHRDDVEDDGVGAGYLGSGILGAMGRRDALVLRTGLRKVLRDNSESSM